MLTLRQFEVFAAVVEAGSFRRCAERMDIAQVSVSDHVRALEKALGVSLFLRRQGAAALLTAEGERVHAHVLDILGGIEQLRADCGTTEKSARRLRIGAHSLLISRLPEAAAAFIERHPQCPVTFDNMDYEEVRDALETGAIDVGLFFSFGQISGIASTAVAQEPLAIFTGLNHPLANIDGVTPTLLGTYPFIDVSGSAHLREALTAALATRGIIGMPVAMQSDNFSIIAEAARRNIGWICCFRHTVTSAMRLNEIGVLSPPSLDIHLALTAHRPADPMLADLVATLTGCFDNRH